MIVVVAPFVRLAIGWARTCPILIISGTFCARYKVVADAVGSPPTATWAGAAVATTLKNQDCWDIAPLFTLLAVAVTVPVAPTVLKAAIIDPKSFPIYL